MSAHVEKEKVFGLKREENPDSLVAIHLREQVCDDPNVSDGAARLFVRLLDMSLNPRLNNGSKGAVLVSQLTLSGRLNCSERSIYRRTLELRNYVWLSYVPKINTKPMICYHIAAFQPRKPLAQEMPGSGVWGNCKRRHDSGGFAKTGKEATGHQRRMGGLLDAWGNPISSFLPVNAAGSGQECPVRAVKSDRSSRTPASDYEESQMGDKSVSEKEKEFRSGLTAEPLNSVSGSPALKPRKGEKDFLERLGQIVAAYPEGKLEMVNWGGRWRNRFRENMDKAIRVLEEISSMHKEKRIHKNPGENPGACANDLWGRFV